MTAVSDRALEAIHGTAPPLQLTAQGKIYKLKVLVGDAGNDLESCALSYSALILSMSANFYVSE